MAPDAGASTRTPLHHLDLDELIEKGKKFHRNPTNARDLDDLIKAFALKGDSFEKYVRSWGAPDEPLHQFYGPRFIRTAETVETGRAFQRSLEALTTSIDTDRQGLPPVTSFQVDREQMLWLVQAAIRLAATNISQISTTREQQAALKILKDLSAKARHPIETMGRLDLDRTSINLILQLAAPRPTPK